MGRRLKAGAHAASLARDRLPIPGQELIEILNVVIVDAGQDVGEPSLGIDAVQLGGLNYRGPLTAAVGAGEQPGLAAERDAAQLALGGIVGEADASVGEEARERIPA